MGRGVGGDALQPTAVACTRTYTVSLHSSSYSLCLVVFLLSPSPLSFPIMTLFPPASACRAARHGAALLQRTAQEAEVALDTLRARAAEVITARDQARESRRHQKQLENDIQCKESRKHYIELLLSADAALVALTAAVQERGEEDEDGELLPRHCGE